MSETAAPGARYRIGAYRFWHRHVAILLAETSPDAEVEYLAHAPLAPLGADLVAAIRTEISAERMRSGVLQLADALVGTS